MFLGSLILFDSPDPIMRVSLTVILPLTLSTGALAIFLIRLVVRTYKRRVLGGQQGIISEAGKAETNISVQKEGKVCVHGELWNAIAEENIKKGEKIIVTKVDGMLLTVKKQ